MLDHLTRTQRYLALVVLAAQIALSGAALLLGWREIFAALGSLLLCLGFTVFLTDRYRIVEVRRLWDSQIETQIRMIWRHQMRVRHGEKTPDPLSIDEIETRVGESFDSMLHAKNHEKKLETYRLEISLSVIGTLQWGFGALLVEFAHS